MRASRGLLFIVGLSLSFGPWGSPAPAQNVEGEGEGLVCTVDGNTVHLSWEALLPDPNSAFAATLERDGEVLARLAAGDVSYSDLAVPEGTHDYRLVLPSAAGVAIVGECRVLVGGDASRVSCTVDGSIVTVRWTLSPDVFAFGFAVSRDGQIVATLGPDARSYREEAPPGKHLYVVSTNNRLGRDGVPAGAPDFLIGECAVVIGESPGISCEAEGSVVSLRWDPLDRTLPIVRIDVRRNERVVAELGADATSYREEVPAGAYVYSVVAIVAAVDEVDAAGNVVAGDDILIGSCRLVVGGEPGLPGPRDLQCAIAESFPVQVQLFWRNPVAYERIVVLRDGLRIASLPGDTTRFSETDPGAGRHTYGVAGVLNGQMSEAATCVVETPGPPARNRLSLVPHPPRPEADANAANGVLAGEDATLEPADTLDAVLENVDPIQAWSLGLCSERSVLEVASAGIEETDAALLNDGAGPTFLVVKIHEGGVTQAAVIDEEDPSDVLPAGGKSSLLRVRYRPGPDAVRGEPYPVRFCEELGDPPVAVLLVTGGFEVVPVTSSGIVVFAARTFLRADANDDADVGMSDGIFLLDWLFRGGPEPPCLEAADANASREVNIADAVYIFQSLFVGGPPPPPPYPECGPARLSLGCEASACEG